MSAERATDETRIKHGCESGSPASSVPIRVPSVAELQAMATALQRTRQRHAAQLFVNAFAVDGTWNNYTEGVALCSNSHTTRSGASTTAGFDNLVTTALSWQAWQTISTAHRPGCFGLATTN